MEIEENRQMAEEFKSQGNESFKKKDYNTAINSYQKAIHCDPNEPSYHGNLAACYLATEKYQLCLKSCDKALDLDPKFTKVLRRKALSQIQLLKFDDALVNIRQGLETDPSDANLRQDLSDCERFKQQYNELLRCIKENNFDQAATLVNSLTQKIQKNNELLVLKVEVLAMKGSTDQAKQLLSQIQHCEEAKRDIHYLQGICELYNGNTDKAKIMFANGMRNDPDNIKCREALKKAKKAEELKEQGNQAIKSQDYDGSIKIYDEALLIDPNNRKLNSVIHSNRALAWVKKKEYKKAMEDVNISISLNENYFRAYLRRADIHMKLGDFSAAVNDYTRVKELDPSQSVDQLIRDAKMQAKQAKKKDYYKILGVERTATEKDITKAYRKLALKWHPDKNIENKDEADKIFRDINEAYQVLSDPKKKQMVDQGVDPNDQESGGMPADFNPNDIFSAFFGGGGGGNGGFGGFGGNGGGGGFPGFGAFGGFGGGGAQNGGGGGFGGFPGGFGGFPGAFSGAGKGPGGFSFRMG